MKIDFRPQKFNNVLVLEEKVSNGIRRVFKTSQDKTIDMTLSALDSLGNAYPKGYYISSSKTYDKNSMLIKSIERNVTGSANSETKLKQAQRSLSGNISGYKEYSIVRNNNKVVKTELNK